MRKIWIIIRQKVNNIKKRGKISRKINSRLKKSLRKSRTSVIQLNKLADIAIESSKIVQLEFGSPIIQY